MVTMTSLAHGSHSASAMFVNTPCTTRLGLARVA